MKRYYIPPSSMPKKESCMILFTYVPVHPLVSQPSAHLMDEQPRQNMQDNRRLSSCQQVTVVEANP